MSNPSDRADELVMVYDAPTQTISEMVCATLQAAGVRAVVENEYRGPAAGWLNYLGNDYGRGVLVPASELELAKAVLDAQSPSEDEILTALQTDAVSIEEAEANVR